jgi:hypothetical protein
MSRWFLVVVLGSGLQLSGCGESTWIKRLSDQEFQHYYALKPFMADDDRKAFLQLKTEAERNKFLKDKELWQRFYKYEEHIRTAIVDGAVQTGWGKDMVLMSWGAPYDKRKLTGRPAPRSEMLVYRFEQHSDGSVLVYVPGSKTEYKAERRFRREVILDSDTVTEIREVDGWAE